MSVNGKFENITSQDMLKDAERFSVSRPKDLLGEVRAALENWPAFATQAGLNIDASNRVAADFRLTEKNAE
jgi:serine/threonine-protein kinase HipA